MKVRSALVYTVLRLLAFFVPFAILMLFPVFRELYWLAAIFAALIGLSLSLLFLRRPLDAARPRDCTSARARPGRRRATRTWRMPPPTPARLRDLTRG